MKIDSTNTLIRTCCNKVSLDYGRKIARRMVSFLQTYNKKFNLKAAGIAANQLGINASVAVLLIKSKPLILINPEVLDFSKSKFAHTEQCLSFPDESLTVYRHDWVVIRSDYSKEEMFFGQKQNSDLDKNSLFESALAQHEISHLFGKTIHDFQWENSSSPKEW